MTSLRNLLVATVLVSAVGCGGGYDSSPASPSPPTSPGPPAGPSSTVTIPMGAAPLGDRAFNPDPVTVAVGTSVTWLNTDAVAHTSTANESGWNSGTIAPGQQFSSTFQVAGTFAYHCAIHPGMVGRVIVH